MSRTKRALPEDIDVTDPREPSLPDSNDELEVGLGMVLHDLNNNVATLEAHTAHLAGEADNIRVLGDRLHDVAIKIERPF